MVDITVTIIYVHLSSSPVARSCILKQIFTVFLCFIDTHLHTFPSYSYISQYYLQGIQTLLDNHLTHAVLAAQMPTLGDLFHDKIEKVRLEFVKLLLKLKHIRVFKVCIPEKTYSVM